MCIYIKSSTPSAFLTDETSWYVLTGNTLFGDVDFLVVLIERILFVSLISNKKAVHVPVRCTLHEGTFRALRNSGCNTLLLKAAVQFLAAIRGEAPGFTPPAKGAGPKQPQHTSGNACWHPASLVQLLRLWDSSVQGLFPGKQSQRRRAVTGRAGSQTGIWASAVTSDVFKETLNTFKVNLMTSCYPEKAKYRKK